MGRATVRIKEKKVPSTTGGCRVYKWAPDSPKRAPKDSEGKGGDGGEQSVGGKVRDTCQACTRSMRILRQEMAQLDGNRMQPRTNQCRDGNGYICC